MKTLQVRTRSAAKRAFTLIEIMVATVIMVVLVGLVIQITSEVLKVWTRSSGKLSANAEARIAMDLITQDLETAVFRNNGQQWLRVEAPKDTEAGGSSLYTDQTVSLKLFSPALDRDKFESDGITPIPGDICAIGYRLAYKKSYAGTNAPEVYALYRRVIDPKITFNDYMGSGNSGPQLTLTDGTLWADFGDGSSTDDSITANVNYLAGNIIEFKVLIYEQPAIVGGLVVPSNATPEGKLEAGRDYAYGGDTDTDGDDVDDGVVRTNKLLYADIILTVITDTGLEMLNNLGKIPETAPEIVQQHGQTFTRRVNFMAHPL
jgi:prepilin-type N-terminal cleavage/methylation domain-containing protein